MKGLNKCLSFLLCLTLLLGLCAPAALAAEEGATIRIYTAGDLVELAEQCTLDSWSVDKVVLLERSIDLSLTDFQPIPTFGGVFDGQGHTISGLDLPAGGEVQGLFRYVQPTGVIRDLTVCGDLLPADHKNTIGGIAGINRGTIANCRFRGTLRGETSVGGIAGINEASGRIINCSFAGTMTGEHYVGGITGQNLGSVVQCRNAGDINTTEVTPSMELEDLDVEDLNSTENMPAGTDIGGIAGFSSGTIQSCRNTGNVGYPHVGYNIGGIAGRQTGYLDSCVNQGLIQGRKDVGGIAGQMEPQLMLKYDQTALDQLWGELDTLESMIDSFLEDTAGAADQLTDKIQGVSDSAAAVKDAAGDLSAAFTGWADGSIDQINDASARVSWVLERMAPVMDTVESALDLMERAADQFSSGLSQSSVAAEYGAEAVTEMALAMQDIQNAATAAQLAVSRMEEAMDLLAQSLGDSDVAEQALRDMAGAISGLADAFAQITTGLEQLYEALEELEQSGVPDTEMENIRNAMETVMDGFSDAADAAQQLSDAIDTLVQNADPASMEAALAKLNETMPFLRLSIYNMAAAAGHLEASMNQMALAAGELAEALDTFSKAGSTLADSFGTLERAAADAVAILEELARMPSIRFEHLEGSVTDEGEALNAAADGFFDSFNALNAALRAQSNLLTDDLQAINKQVGVITDLLYQLQQEQLEKEAGDLLEDVSARDADDSMGNGKIANCENLGGVTGDVNVAGIVGSMAIEYDFDPEDDLTVSGERSIDFACLARAVVHGCVNRGGITAKKNYAGGIVGQMDMGYVAACQGYGSVNSTGGGYVGGIAGQSSGGIGDSWAMSALSGSNYVGGIAGLGTLIQGCRTLIDAESGIPFSGAIAGQVEEDGELTDNLFVHHVLAGVDGVSYQGAAHPLSYEEFCALKGVPAEFTSFELVFTAEGTVVAAIPFRYGGSLARLPDIPEREAHSARWPEMDYSHLTFSRVLEAEYTPYDTALSDGQALPSYLVDGSFSPDAEVSVTQWDAQWSDGKGHPYQATAYTVTVTDEGAEQLSYTLHWRLPEEGEYDLWVLNGSQWVRQAYTPDGSYLLLACTGERITFALTERNAPSILLYGLLLLAVMIIAVVVILVVRGVRKRRRQPLAAANSGE